MTIYAKGTTVPVAKSRAEIETMLLRYGATSFASGWDRLGASILFEVRQRHVKFVLPLPLPDDKAFTRDRLNRLRTKEQAAREWDSACRQRWRALCLVIRAKLEAVESGITSFEHEFLAHIVLPGGGTVGDAAIPAIAHAYETGQMPPMLGTGGQP